jgi:trehalose/maltose hydrolase-like predicted phosphorylase
MLSICPGLPKNWDTLKFNISFKNNNYFINLSHKQLRIEIKSNFSSQIKIEFSNKKIILQTNKIHVLDY